MAVPNTNTFSLQDVVDEINPTTDDLQDCVNDANSSGYDGTYYTAPATSLLEFRNYSHISSTSYSSSVGNRVQSTACGQSVNLTYYHNGSGTYPVAGDYVYSDAALTTPLAKNHYKIGSGGTINVTDDGGFPSPTNTGEVIGTQICL